MSDKTYILSETYNFWGTFSFHLNGKEYKDISGHLHYAPNEGIELLLSLEEELKRSFYGKSTGIQNIDVIKASVVDSKTKVKILGFLFDCGVVNIGNIRASAFLIYPKNTINSIVLKSSNNIDDIDFSNLSMFHSVVHCNACDIYKTNIIREFMRKSSVKDIALSDDFNLSLRVKENWEFYHKADYVFMATDEILEKINNSINEIVGNNDDNILKLRGSSKPRSYAVLNKKMPLTLKNLHSYIKNIWSLLQFFTIATNGDSINISKIAFKIGDDSTQNEMFLLYNFSHYFLKEKDFIYRFENNFIFDNIKDRFPMIIQNFYKKYDELEEFLNIIRNNAEKEYFDLQTAASLIDCLAVIGFRKSYGKTKYQDIVNAWAGEELSDIDFLDNILTNKTNKNKNLGEKICSLRASVYHFNQNREFDVDNYFYSSLIFRIIIIDYIFEEINVPIDIRKQYKKFHLDRIKAIK